jgi:hypothetical protein
MSLTRASASVIKTEEIVGTRNRIINGAMEIDQRNAGASVTVSADYTLDRWQAFENTTGTMTVGQSSSAPTGFKKSLLVTITSAAASLGTNISIIRQYIEGYNMADFDWGTVNAQTVTLSFWVRCSVTGTFTGAVQNGDQDYAYGFSYNILSANTWEKKTITISGAPGGTWGSTNNRGIDLDFSLAGTTGLTIGSWQPNGVGGTYYYGGVGQTNLFATLNATWQITGVQLEVGSTATPFERRPFGTELALCQRYFFRVAAGEDSFTQFAMGRAFSGTAGNGVVQFPVPMRSKPTFAFLGVVGNYDFNPTAISGGAVPASNTHMTVGMDFSSISSGSIFVLGQNSSSTPCGFTFSSEL